MYIIFCIILLVPHDNAMGLDNVMKLEVKSKLAIIVVT